MKDLQGLTKKELTELSKKITVNSPYYKKKSDSVLQKMLKELLIHVSKTGGTLKDVSFLLSDLILKKEETLKELNEAMCIKKYEEEHSLKRKPYLIDETLHFQCIKGYVDTYISEVEKELRFSDIRSATSDTAGANTLLSANIGEKEFFNIFVLGIPEDENFEQFIAPNIKLANSSYFVVGKNAATKQQTEDFLVKNGYVGKTLDLTKGAKTLLYNPIKYIRDFGDCIKLAALMTKEEERGDYWAQYESGYLANLLEYAKRTNGSFKTVVEMIDIFIENPDKGLYTLDEAFGFSHVHTFSKEKEIALYKKLRSLFTEEMLTLTSGDDELDLYSLGKRKEVLYLILSEDNPNNNLLGEILCEQIVRIAKDNIFEEHLTLIFDECGDGIIKLLDGKALSALFANNVSSMIIASSVCTLPQMKLRDLVKECHNTVYLGNHFEEDEEFFAIQMSEQTKTSLSHPVSSSPEFLAMKDDDCLVIKRRDNKTFLDKKLKTQ